MKWFIVLCLSVFVCLAGCRFGGAKVKADTPYGSGEIEVEERELDIEGIVPEPAPAEDAARNEAVAPIEGGRRPPYGGCRHCPGLTLIAPHKGSSSAESEVRSRPLFYPRTA